MLACMLQHVWLVLDGANSTAGGSFNLTWTIASACALDSSLRPSNFSSPLHFAIAELHLYSMHSLSPHEAHARRHLHIPFLVFQCFLPLSQRT